MTESLLIPDITVPVMGAIEMELPVTDVLVLPVAGPQGPTGDVTGALGVEVVQVTPAATWTFAVPTAFGRTPSVAVYVGGEQVVADITADSSAVSIQFPNPTAGSAVLT